MELMVIEDLKRKLFLLPLLSGLFVVCALSAGTAFANRYCDREDVQAFMRDMSDTHGLNYAELMGMVRKAERQQAVLDAISRPAEKKLTWGEYRPIFITDAQARKGARFWHENAQALQQARERFGVPPEIIVAIIGVETRYGTNKGKHPVFDSLLTLGFDGVSRQGFFKKELGEFLLLARDEQFDPLAAKGSYAGAMGIPQFISSSYRMYAVDFDGDKQRNLFDNPADAIGSVANYFKRHGWKAGKAVSVPVQIKNRKVKKIAVGRGRKGLKPSLSVGELKKAGVKFNHRVEPERLAVLLELEGDKGMEYWVGFKNFYVITRYNISAMYAMAVYQLSQRIKQEYNSLAQQNLGQTVNK